MSGDGHSVRWLTAALVASGMLVAGSPFVGQITTWLRDVARGNYATVLAAVVLGAAALAVGSALLLIRERRWERYGWLLAAILVAVGYATVSRTGVPDVDAAERLHFIEYGLVAVLFYKAWRRSADGSAIVLPLLAGFIVGTCEEWLQWFVPARVGEARDVLLNLVAVATGVLFGLGLDPPGRVTLRLGSLARRRVGRLAAVAIVTFAVFVQSVHLGYQIADRDVGVFRSRYSAEELAELGVRRAAEWRVSPPLTWSRLSREDQYFTEGIAHVRRRNELWDAGNRLAARHENLILEKYYTPVLDTPSYVSATGHRWPAAQRAEADAVGSPGFMIYDSDALPYPVFTWPRWLFWFVVGVLAALVLHGGGRPHRV